MTLPVDQHEDDALGSITRMLTGTQMLKDQPGVVYALAQQRAHPADAQTIDQFMQGLDLEKQVRIASASNRQVILSSPQRTLLNSLGVDYSQAEYTHQDAANDTASMIEQQSGGKVKVLRDSAGNPVIGEGGNLQTEEVHHKSSGFGRLVHDLKNWTVKPLGKVANAAMKPFNVVSQTLGTAVAGLNDVSGDFGLAGDIVNPLKAGHDVNALIHGHPGDVDTSINLNRLPNDINAISGSTPEMNQQMRDAGYDPANPFSILAYRASGHEHTDLSPLEKHWDDSNPSGLYGMNGQQAVSEVRKFLDDPKQYEREIVNDPTLTPDQVSDKLKTLSSPQFTTLAREVQSRESSVGNAVMNGIGLDPVKHSTAYAVSTAGINLAAAFMIDPFIVAGKVFKIARINQVGIDTLGDAAGAAKVLDAEKSRGVFARGVQSRTQSFLDLSHQMGEAEAAGDTVKASALSARIAAQHKEWAPLIPDVLGKNRITGWTEKVVAGKKVAEPIYGEGEPIRTLGDMANYVASRSALIRLMNGRAAVQTSLMPGAISGFGVRALKGHVAEWMTARSAQRAVGAQQSVISAAEADPALAAKLIDDGSLLRIQATADDAVDAFSGATLAEKAADEAPRMASEERGALELTPAGKGDIAFNLRRYGTPLGTTKAGWASPTAVAARARLAGQRLSTLLPRNTLIDINDAASSDKVFKLAMTYMNRGDASALRVAWNTGGAGQRKAIIHGLLDQVSHAAGLTRTESGRNFMQLMKTRIESYSTVGDDVVLDGDTLALHAGQVRTKWYLPTFRDLNKASAKIGLWEATLGRPLTSGQADLIMSQWKLGALFKPSTITRNQTEGWLRTALEGQFGDAVRAKAYASSPNSELWARGLGNEDLETYRAARGKVEGLQKMLKDKGLSREQRADTMAQVRDTEATIASVIDRPVVQHLLATESGDTKLADQIAKGTMLSGDHLGRSAVTQRVAEFAPFALTGRAWRYLFGKSMEQGDLEALATLGGDELGEAMAGYSNQITEADLGFRRAARESGEIAQAGYGPSLLKRTVHNQMKRTSGDKADEHIVSWTQRSTDGTVGADRYATALAQRVNATPGVAHAVLNRIEDPENFDINHVVEALDDPKIRNEMQLTGYGSVYWTDPTGPALRALTPEQVLIGKQEWAQKVVNDYAYLLTGQNGHYQQDVADFVREEGRAPDSSWIQSHLIDGEDGARPVAVLAPEVVEVPSGGPKGLFAALQDVEGAGYQWMVERPLQRTTSSPVFLANYAKARRGLNTTVDQLVEQGISREAANAMAKELSVRNAWIKTEQLIDDPGQKSQFDIVARNMFPFSRATQAMIRRWGSGLWQDPVRAQKMMLSYEGAVHSGFVYENAYGEPTFVYPGSGVMNMAMRELAKVPGFGGLARFPVSASMTGGVLMSVPGADNPFRMSAGPMITIPLREVSKLLPGDQRVLFDEVDSAINGPVGQGQTVGQLVPTAFRRMYQAMSTDDRNSALASSTMGAVANLAAAGQIPGPDASASERQEFLNNLRTQVRSQLFLRAVFGLFAPASPSQPSEGTDGSQADYAFNVRGAGQLSEEYKLLVNDVGGDIARANAIWTALHPDKVVYEIGHSRATSSHVALPATRTALQWMNENDSFVHKYGAVAAYFLPEDSGNEPFSDQAYKTQLELGLRERKTPGEFLEEIYTRHAEAIFYPAVQQFDAKIDAAKKDGDDATASQWSDAKSSWEAQFKNLNPLFGKKLDSYGDARAKASEQLGDIRRMLTDGDVPSGMQSKLQLLVRAYDGYESYIQTHKGSDTISTQARSSALQMFNDWALHHIYNTPLADLYSGVFRVLNTNFVSFTPQGGGQS